MAKSEIEEIDALLDGEGAPSIGPGTKAEAVGAVQDLLSSHGYPGMFPINDDPLDEKQKDADDRPYKTRYGKFYGKATKAAIRDFRAKQDLPPFESIKVDKPVLERLLALTPSQPLASRVYLTRKLDLEFKGFTEVVSAVSLGESGGRFDATTDGYDKAGQSFSLLQWAQSQKRLTPVFRRLATDPKELMETAFGAEALAKILAFLEKPHGGLNRKGKPADPGDKPYDLTLPTHRARLEAVARVPAVQKTLIDQAAKELKAEKARFDAVSTTALDTVRGVAFLLDMSNQFGPIVVKWYREAVKAGLSGMDKVVPKMFTYVDARIDSAAKKYKWSAKTTASVKRSRRNRVRFFRFSPFVSDAKFSGT